MRKAGVRSLTLAEFNIDAMIVPGAGQSIFFENTTFIRNESLKPIREKPFYDLSHQKL